MAIAAPVDSAETLPFSVVTTRYPILFPMIRRWRPTPPTRTKRRWKGCWSLLKGRWLPSRRRPIRRNGARRQPLGRRFGAARRGKTALIFVDDGSSAEHATRLRSRLYWQKEMSLRILSGRWPTRLTITKLNRSDCRRLSNLYTTQSALPAIALGLDQFSIATFNVENLFDTVDPILTIPPQPTSAEYEARLLEVADTLVALAAPTVIGLQEVENIGVLEAIAAQPQLAEFGYEAVLIEGDDSRGIDVGYLVRGDQATIESVESFPATEGLTTRHPLLLQVRLTVDDTAQTVYIINNHFLSLSAGEEATEPRRAAQAAWNVAIMNRVLERDPDANFVVLGDLNSFVDTLPLQTLTDAGLVHVYDFFADPDDIPYTYIFEGMTQTLDHILVSPGMFAQLTGG